MPGNLIRFSADFSAEILYIRWEEHNIFKVMKAKIVQLRILYLAKLFRIEGELTSFPDKQKRKSFSITKLAF